MQEEIRQQLMALQDASYKTFSEKLIPESKPLIGVRLPKLRAMAKKLAKEDWKALVTAQDADAQDIYFEEVMLRGMLIGYGCSAAGDIAQALMMLDKFIPLVDNWSVCDSFCVSFEICERYRAEVFPHLKPYLYSEKEFEVRVGLILLLNHYLKIDGNGKKIPRLRQVDKTMLEMKPETQDCGIYITQILETLDRPFTQGYYAQMAAAWLTAECFVTYPAQTDVFLRDNRLDTYTFNKALQKICESRIPDDAVKAYIRSLKIKA